MKIERSLIKYYAVSAVSLLCAIAYLVIRIDNTVWYFKAHTECKQNTGPVVLLHILLILATVAAFSPCLIAKTKRGIRLAVCLSTLFAAVVSVSVLTWYTGLYMSLVSHWPWATIILYFVCLICSPVAFVMTALDDRKENGAAQDQ